MKREFREYKDDIETWRDSTTQTDKEEERQRERGEEKKRAKEIKC